ncbi:MAG TPA: hypothetical protein PL024_05660 [Thauera sp.]|nr:hypothetical protein [Thauera sp.]HRA80969.1 hypothetical protein [Thauera sp.]
MNFPAFFDAVPRLQVCDPLAEFLGAAEGGVLEYAYADVVRLAGHSCPTVAAAYVLGCRALAALYPDALPQRGGVSVNVADLLGQGVTGVTASVLTLLTGATGEGGFKGIGGRFVRRGLLDFGSEQTHSSIRITRLDTGAAVDVDSDLSQVPADPDLSRLFGRCARGEADAAERRRFGELWQQRVERILLEHWDDDAVFSVRPVA